MFDKLEDLVRRFEEITNELTEPSVVNDQNRFRKLMKEQSDLQPLVDAYTEYRKCQETVEDSLAMLESESDDEMREMLKEEMSDAKKRIIELEQEMKILLLPKDPNDEKNVIVEIRAGAGGDEAALFAAEVYRMYVHYAESRRWKTEIVECDEIGIGGMKSVTFMINGQGAYSMMKYESGVHRVQRVPETESGGRIHTSTISVAVMPEVDEDIDIKFTGLRPVEKLYEELLMSEEGLQITENKLIHIGKPIEFDEDLFVHQLEELNELSKMDSPDIKKRVAEIVPTYHMEEKRQ